MMNTLWQFITSHVDALDILYIMTAFAFMWDQIEMMYEVDERSEELEKKYRKQILALKRQNKQLKERIERHEQCNTETTV